LGYGTPDKVYRTATGGGAKIVDKFKEKKGILSVIMGACPIAVRLRHPPCFSIGISTS